MCAKVCHRGHDITYARYSRFFCDCGAGKQPGRTCQALNPREPPEAAPALAAAGLRQGEGVLGQGEGVLGSASSRSPDGTETEAGVGGVEAQEDEVDISSWLADCDKLPGQLTRQVRVRVPREP